MPESNFSIRQKVMVDLFCGRGGWTKGFLAHGWRCIGIDLFPQPDYPGEFIQADIAHLLELPEADFYCCSSPCENFSVFGLKAFHKSPKWPWRGIALFNWAKQLLEATGKPYIMENVRCAQQFVGKSDNHMGPFYLWGTGVPALFPFELRKLNKGMALGIPPNWATASPEEIRAARRTSDKWYVRGKRQRAQTTATIPEVLSSHIAQMAGLM